MSNLHPITFYSCQQAVVFYRFISNTYVCYVFVSFLASDTLHASMVYAVASLSACPSVCHTHIVYYNKMAEHAMSNHVHHVVALPHCFSRTKFTRDERATNIISRSKVTENEHRASQHNTCNNVTHGATSSSAIEERLCNASCLSAVSFNSIIH